MAPVIPMLPSSSVDGRTIFTRLFSRSSEVVRKVTVVESKCDSSLGGCGRSVVISRLLNGIAVWLSHGIPEI